jgi:RNA polymerase sigma-70 factor, ECF subfamily
VIAYGPNFELIFPLSLTPQQIDELMLAGARRALARAANSRSLAAEGLTSRLRAAADKYIFKHDPAADAVAVDGFLDGLHADDLCLVLACECGDEQAWNDLFAGYSVTVRSAARSASSNEAMADDLAQSIWAELHGLRSREDGRPGGKLAYYSGVGSLGGWLRAVVGQLAIDQHRRQTRLVQAEEDSDLDRMALDESDTEREGAYQVSATPEELLANQSAGADVENALAHALAGLADEDRLLMKLYYFDGLRLREAGAVLGVHEATASRRLTRIHGEVRQKVESILMKEHGWTKTEAARMLSEIATNLQTDVEPMLVAKSDSPLQSSAT